MNSAMGQIAKNRPAFTSECEAAGYARSLESKHGVRLCIVECDDDTYRLATFEQWKRLKIESEQ